MSAFNIIEFSARLKCSMKAWHFTAEKLSEVTDIPAASIRNWTCGHSMPRLDAVTAMADAMQVSIDWLCGLRGRSSWTD